MGSRPLVLAAFGALLATLTVEAILRLVEATPLRSILPVAEAALYGPDAATGYTHRPGASGMWVQENRAFIAINSLGLRDRLDRTLAKPAGATRWAIVGDSVTEALQVPLELTFPFIAERTLQGRLGRGVEILNLGLAGATPAVIVERAASQRPRLGLDGIVVLKSIGEFARDTADDPSEYPGYVAAADGTARISHAFRDGPGYRLRTSPRGAAIYRALDALRIARVLNSRKNVGLLAELKAPPVTRATPAAIAACDASAHARTLALWRGVDTTFANRRLTAFLADLAAIARSGSIPIVLALQSVSEACPDQDAGPVTLRQAIAERLDAAGLGFVDMDRALRTRLAAGQPLSDLAGFGLTRGRGHLNEDGHRAYADVMATTVAAALCHRTQWPGC